MTPATLLDRIARLRALAVVRADTAEQALAAAEACARGGVRLLEITLTVPGALDVVRALAGRADVAVGVGSVTTADQVRDAARAGAQFSVSPHFDPEVLAVARAEGLLCSMAGLTPTELLRCHQEGVELVKVFPAGAVGGPSFVKAVREPLPFLKLMPTGGVDASNLEAYLAAGAFALGLGGSLIDRDAVRGGHFAAIEARAARVAAAVARFEDARASSTRP
jgi:2-dehydro-3-deoxyphosphogluconate aldolase/(4S)-4-hydroxy-2-oxoglutarate aldolase